MRQVTVRAIGQSPTRGWVTSESNATGATMFADRVQTANILSYLLPSPVPARASPIGRGSACFPPWQIDRSPMIRRSRALRRLCGHGYRVSAERCYLIRRQTGTDFGLSRAGLGIDRAARTRSSREMAHYTPSTHWCQRRKIKMEELIRSRDLVALADGERVMRRDSCYLTGTGTGYQMASGC